MSRGPGGNPQVDLGSAFQYGWAKFQENLGPILIGLIGLFVVTAVLGFIWQVIVGGIFDGGGLFASLLASSIGSFVFAIGGYVIQGAMIRAGFDLVDGRSLDTGRLFDTSMLGPVIVTGLLISIITTIGYILCFFPGLIAAIVLSFSLHFVVDQGASPTDALRASVELFRENTGQALLLAVATFIVAFAGAILCGVGLLVTVPVALIAQAYGFRQLNGQPVPSV